MISDHLEFDLLKINLGLHWQSGGPVMRGIAIEMRLEIAPNGEKLAVFCLIWPFAVDF